MQFPYPTPGLGLSGSRNYSRSKTKRQEEAHVVLKRGAMVGVGPTPPLGAQGWQQGNKGRTGMEAVQGS